MPNREKGDVICKKGSNLQGLNIVSTVKELADKTVQTGSNFLPLFFS